MRTRSAYVWSKSRCSSGFIVSFSSTLQRHSLSVAKIKVTVGATLCHRAHSRLVQWRLPELLLPTLLLLLLQSCHVFPSNIWFWALCHCIRCQNQVMSSPSLDSIPCPNRKHGPVFQVKSNHFWRRWHWKHWLIVWSAGVVTYSKIAHTYDFAASHGLWIFELFLKGLSNS